MMLFQKMTIALGFVAVSAFASEPMAPILCKEGRATHFLERYVPVGSGYSCPQYKWACVLPIADSRCPKVAALPCPDGQIQKIPDYVEVAGGFFCDRPKAACVKINLCPLPAPLNPNYCRDGLVMSRTVDFLTVDAQHSCPAYEIVCVKQTLCSMSEEFSESEF